MGRVERAILAVLFLAPLAPIEGQTRSAEQDVSNRFPNVGALLVWSEPNDAGIPVGLVGRCTGALIGPNVFLTAGHCVAPAAQNLAPFIHTFVTFGPTLSIDRAGDASPGR